MTEPRDLIGALRDSLVPCPVCGAVGSRPCLGTDGAPVESHHQQRHPPGPSEIWCKRCLAFHPTRLLHGLPVAACPKIEQGHIDTVTSG